MSDQPPSSSAQGNERDAGHSAFSDDLSKFRKLKDKVMNNAQSYIRRCATVISQTLSPDHEAVKCLSAFGNQAQKFAAEVLAIVQWGTQHWKLHATFPVPVIPRSLQTPLKVSCLSCPRPATSRTYVCIVRLCGPRWLSSCNIVRIT